MANKSRLVVLTQSRSNRITDDPFEALIKPYAGTNQINYLFTDSREFWNSGSDAYDTVFSAAFQDGLRYHKQTVEFCNNFPMDQTLATAAIDGYAAACVEVTALVTVTGMAVSLHDRRNHTLLLTPDELKKLARLVRATVNATNDTGEGLIFLDHRLEALYRKLPEISKLFN